MWKSVSPRGASAFPILRCAVPVWHDKLGEAHLGSSGWLQGCREVCPRRHMLKHLRKAHLFTLFSGPRMTESAPLASRTVASIATALMGRGPGKGGTRGPRGTASAPVAARSCFTSCAPGAPRTSRSCTTSWGAAPRQARRANRSTPTRLTRRCRGSSAPSSRSRTCGTRWAPPSSSRGPTRGGAARGRRPPRAQSPRSGRRRSRR